MSALTASGLGDRHGHRRSSGDRVLRVRFRGSVRAIDGWHARGRETAPWTDREVPRLRASTSAPDKVGLDDCPEPFDPDVESCRGSRERRIQSPHTAPAFVL